MRLIEVVFIVRVLRGAGHQDERIVRRGTGVNFFAACEIASMRGGVERDVPHLGMEMASASLPMNLLALSSKNLMNCSGVGSV